MKRLKGFHWLFLLLWLPLTWALPAQADEVAKVVYHVDFDDTNRYSATLTSINNMLNEYENQFKEYDVSIVFVGLGARFITDTDKAGINGQLKERRAELKGRLSGLHSMRNVKLAVCNNTLTGFGMKAADLYEGVEVVPSGVVYLAELQEGGASYIKIQ